MNARSRRLVAIGGLITLIFAAPANAIDSGWQAQVAKLITANYSYPRSAMIRHEQGRALVRIVISKTGEPISIELVQSSGSEILDREAIRIPKKVATFPRPPAGENVAVVFPIKWQLD